jgi:hypothetical protein
VGRDGACHKAVCTIALRRKSRRTEHARRNHGRWPVRNRGRSA